jgi:hypothetical protein
LLAGLSKFRKVQPIASPVKAGKIAERIAYAAWQPHPQTGPRPHLFTRVKEPDEGWHSGIM